MQLYGSLQDLRQGDESVTQFIQNGKALFDELVATGRSVSLEDFNLYVFHGLREEFKDLVTSLVTKAEPLLYADIHSHLLTHEFLHKISLSSMRSVVINTPLLPMLNTPPTAFISHRQSPGNFGRSRCCFHGGWCPNQFNNRGHRSVASRPNFCSLPHSFNGDSDGRAIGRAAEGRIHVASCAKLSAIQPLTALNSNIEAMDSSLVQI